MKSLLFVFLVSALALTLTVAGGNDKDNSVARLLVGKHIQNKYLVENRDLVVKYSLFNVGDSAAVNVQLTDRGFPGEHFELVGGVLAVKLDRLAPRANHSHTAVLRPKFQGYFNFTAAEVQYRASDDSEELQMGFSSDPGQGAVIPLKEYERQFSAHMVDWVLFAVMTLPSLGIPFLLWHSSKAKYEAIAKAKRD